MAIHMHADLSVCRGGGKLEIDLPRFKNNHEQCAA